MKINGKELKTFGTSGFNDLFQGLEAQLYTNIVNSVLSKKPVDMLIFEYKEGIQTARSAGYDLNTSELDETTILWSAKSLPTPTFWFKIDDYGDHYVGTFLLPEEY